MDLNWVIPELIDYVTFRKGPYYADVGDFSSAGTAAFHLVKTLLAGLAKVGIGQDDYYRVLIAQTLKIGPGHLLYAFEANSLHGPWDNNEQVRKFNGVLKYSLTSGLSTFSLGFAAYSNTWDATDQIPQRAVDQGLISRLGTIDTSDGGRTSRYSLYSEWSRKSDKSLTEANAYLTYYRLHLFSNFTFSLTIRSMAISLNSRTSGSWSEARRPRPGLPPGSGGRWIIPSVCRYATMLFPRWPCFRHTAARPHRHHAE